MQINALLYICEGIFIKFIELPRTTMEYPNKMIGLPRTTDNATMEYIGIALSILSITKRCVTWWMTRGPAQEPSPPLCHSIMGALFFFLPHIAFRTTALAFCWRFLGYNTLWAVAIILLHTIATFAFLYRAEKNSRSKDGLIFSAVLSLLVPLAFLPDERSHRILMKRTLVCKNIINFY